MKLTKLFAGLGALALATSLTGCSLLDFLKTESDIEFIPVQLKEDGDWSFVTKEGQVILEDEFSKRPSVVLNGYFSVETKDGYALYKFDEKKPVAVEGCEALKDVGFMSEGLVPVTYDKSRITVIDGDGKEKFILNPIKGKEVVQCADGFTDGMLRIYNEDYKVGYVNTKGNAVVEPKYSFGSNFVNGRAVVSIQKDEDVQWMVIDKKGEKKFNIKAGWFYSDISEDIILVCDKENRYAYIDDKGELTKLPAKVKHLWSATVQNDCIIFNDGEGFGLMKLDGEVVIRPKYNFLTFLDDKTLLGKKDDYAQLLDFDGEEKARIDDVDYALAIPGWGIFAKDSHSFQLLNDEGKQVGKDDFNDISLSSSASGIVTSDFFNVSAMVETVTSQISAQGIGKYRLGATPASVFGGSPSYSDTYRSESDYFDFSEASGYKFESRIKLLFDKSMADYNYDYYSYSSSYSWNYDAKLFTIMQEISLETEANQSMITGIVNSLKKKGFKAVTPEGRPWIVFSNGTTVGLVGYEKNKQKIGIFLGKNINGMLLPTLKRLAGDNNKEVGAISDSESGAYYEAEAEVVAVDSVAAE